MSRKEFALRMMRDYQERYPLNYFGKAYVHETVIVPTWVSIGKWSIIHAGVTLGSQGFGFQEIDGQQVHIPHAGKLIIGDRVEIFENCNIARGTIGATYIGDGTKIDALCHVGHNCSIGENCIITAGVIFAGSVKLRDNVYVGINSSIRDHVSITDGVFIGQGSNVVSDITERYSVWAGNPAKLMRGRKLDE